MREKIVVFEKNGKIILSVRKLCVLLRRFSTSVEAKEFNNIIHQNKNNMIVVPVKEGENIERALKKFKRKFEKTGVVKELRRRQQFDKPSVLKRLAKERAIYVQQLRRVED